MSTAENKLSLVQMIVDSDDRAFIKQMIDYARTLKKTKTTDWADDLSTEEEASIIEGLKQESEGIVKSHDQILAKHRKQFPHLNL